MTARKRDLSRYGGSSPTASAPTWQRSNKVFTFQNEVSKGNKGEAWLMHHYHSPIIPHHDHSADFIRHDGLKLELKTDWYSLSNTEYFFIERWGDIDKKKPGGPWQSLGKADVFVYLFIRDGVYFEFDDMKELIKRLNKLTKDLKLIRIQNRGYAGGGYKVKLTDLADLYTDYRLYYSVDETE